MSRWIELSMQVDGEAAEAVAEVLHRYGQQGVVIEQRLGPDEGLPVDALPAGPLTVRAYLPDDADAPGKKQQIREALYFLGKLYPLPEPTFATLEDEDWSEAWKANYEPVRVGRKLLIKPAWLDVVSAPDDVVIELDPGMAFGSGTHPSTQLCLAALEDLIGPAYRVLDLGSGSGLLAIAAARLGATYVLALDVDPLAVQVGRDNVDANRVSQQVHVQSGSLGSVLHAPRRFDLVVVNILAHVIVEMCASGLGSVVRPGGWLIAAGIIHDQANDVVQALEDAGLPVQQRRQAGDWVALLARRPQQ